MRVEEAQWIGSVLSDLSVACISPVLELGSSTRAYRCVEKPHIEEFIHRPLRERGVQVVHTDVKKGEGIDISGDVYEPTTVAELLKVKTNCILCCNIFQHIVDRDRFARTCGRLLQPGGYMVVAVPRSYPYHLDSLDTYFRSSPSEIATLFRRYSEIGSATIRSGDYLKEISNMPHPVAMAVREMGRIALCRGVSRPQRLGRTAGSGCSDYI